MTGKSRHAKAPISPTALSVLLFFLNSYLPEVKSGPLTPAVDAAGLKKRFI